MFYYQSDSDGARFGVFSFQATYDSQILYGNTKDGIGQAIRELHENARPGEPLVMPEITPVSLTAKQQARFDEISTIPGITLDDVANYTLSGTPGTSTAYQIFMQQQTISALEVQLTAMNTAIERGLA